MSPYALACVFGLAVGFLSGIYGSNLVDKDRVKAGMMVIGSVAYKIEKVTP